MRFRGMLLVVAATCAPAPILGVGTAAAADPYEAAMATVKEKYGVNIKGVFAGNCSWCHDGYGMEGGKGPKLAGTQKTFEQVIDRITHGKSGYMPPFGKTLGEEKIEALATYIKMLPGDQ